MPCCAAGAWAADDHVRTAREIEWDRGAGAETPAGSELRVDDPQRPTPDRDARGEKLASVVHVHATFAAFMTQTRMDVLVTRPQRR